MWTCESCAYLLTYFTSSVHVRRESLRLRGERSNQSDPAPLPPRRLAVCRDATALAAGACCSQARGGPGPAGSWSERTRNDVAIGRYEVSVYSTYNDGTVLAASLSCSLFRLDLGRNPIRAQCPRGAGTPPGVTRTT